MESGDPHAAHVPAHELAQALAHFRGCLVREGDRHDLPGSNAKIDHQMRDAMREHTGLAAAGARENQKRSFGAQHGFALRFVQGFKIDRHSNSKNW